MEWLLTLRRWEFESVGFNLETYQIFSVHTTREEFKTQ